MDVSLQVTDQKLYKQAFWLGLFTIIYNIIEGAFSIILGYASGTLTLFGFGIDSFIEVLSGIGITMMVIRIEKNPQSQTSTFELKALKITGTSFYLLSLGLLTSIIFNIVHHHKPETALWGLIISLVSIVVMVWLMVKKKKTGRQLNSDPIITDSNCTKICVYMSLILLASSLIYLVSGFSYADVIGAAGIIFFSLKEGREAFEKANDINRHRMKSL